MYVGIKHLTGFPFELESEYIRDERYRDGSAREGEKMEMQGSKE